eukprot:368635_1
MVEVYMEKDIVDMVYMVLVGVMVEILIMDTHIVVMVDIEEHTVNLVKGYIINMVKVHIEKVVVKEHVVQLRKEVPEKNGDIQKGGDDT